MTTLEICSKLKPSRGYSLFPVNIRSAKCKEYELEALFREFDFEFVIIMLIETWYTNRDEVLRIPKYTAFFLNRETRRGGGLLLQTKNKFNSDVLPNLSIISRDFEVLTVKRREQILSVAHPMVK